ncbi:MAG TPA: trypsin-like peptidase domain-containing protein [Chthoniobacterales bacterium]
MFGLLGQDSSGSGFIIRSDGYVLTNHHVVADASRVEITVPNLGQFEAVLVADDEYKDLALLKIRAAGLATLPIAESRKANVLDVLIVLGYPYGLELGSEVSASEGRINAIRDEGKIPLFQIDANVNPGNSGGPALNDRGEVVGVIVSKLNAAYFLKTTGSIPERVNFAIPIDEARGVIRQAYPLGFEVSARHDQLTIQQVFDQARSATVLVTASRSDGQSVVSEPEPPETQPFAPEPTHPNLEIRRNPAVDFVKSYVGSGTTGAPFNELDFYARNVTYFNDGFVDRNFISRDIARYNKKWPIRAYWIVEGPDVSAASTPGQYNAVCKIQFRVRNLEKGVEGTVLQKMIIGQVDNGFVVLGVTSAMQNRRTIPGGTVRKPAE